MSQHHQRTQHGPSRGSIGLLAGLTVAALIAVGWVASGPVSSELIGGAVLGSLLFVGLSCQLAGRLIERRTVLDRRWRELDAERAAQEREMAATTGTWEGKVGEMLTVRYEAAYDRWWVHGWLGEFRQISELTEWSGGKAGLVSAVAELEETGELVPWRDEGTDYVRSMLALVVDELYPDVAGLDHWDDSPSPAALSRLSVPVPRDEAEREQWRIREGRTRDLSGYRPF